MRSVFVPAAAGAAGVLLLLAGYSSGANKPAAAPPSPVAVPRTTAALTAPTSAQPASCSLKLQGDIIERVVVPGQPATVQQLGSINLQDCTLAFNDLAAETNDDPGYCTTAAWLSDNPGYDVNAVPAPPLKKVQAQAGAACG